MGFSVSGAAAIVFASMFVAFGMYYSAAGNSMERVTDAESERSDGLLEQRNTHVEIASAVYDNDTKEVSVDVENAGASQLRLSTTDLLLDGGYETGWAADAVVAGDPETDLWLAGETVTINVSRASQPDRVKVVTETGVADAAAVIRA